MGPMALVANDLTFAEALDELVAVGSRRGDDPPSWERVEVFESRVGPGQDPTFTDAGAAGDYEERWRAVLGRIQRDWVNLRLLPIRDGALGVLVEYVDSDDVPAQGRIALNLGGKLTLA